MKLVQIINNLHQITIRGTTFWFSYETPIAYKPLSCELVVRENEWGKTTGKHINYVKGLYNHTQLKGRDFEWNMGLYI